MITEGLLWRGVPMENLTDEEVSAAWARTYKSMQCMFRHRPLLPRYTPPADLAERSRLFLAAMDAEMSKRGIVCWL